MLILTITKQFLWCDEHLSTPVVSNTAKGKHYFFKQLHSLERRNTANKGCGIDIRANGGYVVAPPSVHGSGNFYRWSNHETPMVDDIPEMSLAEYEVLQELLNPTQKYTTPHRIFYQNSVKNHKSASPQVSILLLKKEEETMLSLVKPAVF